MHRRGFSIHFQNTIDKLLSNFIYLFIIYLFVLQNCGRICVDIQRETTQTNVIATVQAVLVKQKIPSGI